MPFKLDTTQQAVVNSVINALTTGGPTQVFRVDAPAGSGKTQLLQCLLETAHAKRLLAAETLKHTTDGESVEALARLHIEVVAPTHKALDVIRARLADDVLATTSIRTIYNKYSLAPRNPYEAWGVDRGVARFGKEVALGSTVVLDTNHASLSPDDLDGVLRRRLLVVDEAGLLNASVDTMLRQTIANDDDGLVVLLLGDKRQAPPINHWRNGDLTDAGHLLRIHEVDDVRLAREGRLLFYADPGEEVFPGCPTRMGACLELGGRYRQPESAKYLRDTAAALEEAIDEHDCVLRGMLRSNAAPEPFHAWDWWWRGVYVEGSGCVRDRLGEVLASDKSAVAIDTWRLGADNVRKHIADAAATAKLAGETVLALVGSNLTANRCNSEVRKAMRRELVRSGRLDPTTLPPDEVAPLPGEVLIAREDFHYYASALDEHGNEKRFRVCAIPKGSTVKVVDVAPVEDALLSTIVSGTAGSNIINEVGTDVDIPCWRTTVRLPDGIAGEPLTELTPRCRIEGATMPRTLEVLVPKWHAAWQGVGTGKWIERVKAAAQTVFQKRFAAEKDAALAGSDIPTMFDSKAWSKSLAAQFAEMRRLESEVFANLSTDVFYTPAQVQGTEADTVIVDVGSLLWSGVHESLAPVDEGRLPRSDGRIVPWRLTGVGEGSLSAMIANPDTPSPLRHEMALRENSTMRVVYMALTRARHRAVLVLSRQKHGGVEAFNPSEVAGLWL